jgi:hypothetical protein
VTGGKEEDEAGTVEFVAHYWDSGRDLNGGPTMSAYATAAPESAESYRNAQIPSTSVSTVYELARRGELPARPFSDGLGAFCGRGSKSCLLAERQLVLLRLPLRAPAGPRRV